MQLQTNNEKKEQHSGTLKMWKADIWIVLLESFSDKQKQQTNKKVIAQRRKNFKYVAECFEDRGARKASLLQLWAAH